MSVSDLQSHRSQALVPNEALGWGCNCNGLCVRQKGQKRAPVVVVVS